MKRFLTTGSSLTNKITWLVFVLAVVFADVMYLKLVWNVVDGLLAVLAFGGAFALAASVIMLPLKLKNGDIKDGDQRSIAIAVLMIEFGLMILNTVVAFAEAAGDMAKADQFLSVYATYIAPATPIIVAAGFLLIWLFDPIDQAERAKHQARTAEAITKAEIETELRLSTLEGVRRNIDSPAYKELVDAEIQRQTIQMLKATFDVMRLGNEQPSVPPMPPVLPVVLPPIEQPQDSNPN